VSATDVVCNPVGPLHEREAMPHCVKAQLAQHARNISTCEVKAAAAKSNAVAKGGLDGMTKKKQKTEEGIVTRGDILSSA
jgi:hypothetical protein